MAAAEELGTTAARSSREEARVFFPAKWCSIDPAMKKWSDIVAEGRPQAVPILQLRLRRGFRFGPHPISRAVRGDLLEEEEEE